MEREREVELIELAAAGDRVAAGELIRAHQQSVYAYLLRMSGRTDVAEDIVQEAFVRVLGNLHRFDFRFRFSTWLFTIARRLYMNAMAKSRPSYDTDFVGSFGNQSTGWAPDTAMYDDERQTVQRDALQTSLMELSEEQREVLVLFHQLDWPIALIAEHLAMPEGTVKSHLHRGRRRLRQVFQDKKKLGARVEEVWR
ncbi:RNA polymerase sigma factor [Nodularia spumigena]|jgi:RNA polymerase sigma-70 factor (ECF subfamily)|uniref:RNA polymerase sigma factor n=1 Tax=Nodularia spumigena TaxID=70799 RepID=UPI002B220ED3|nr:sigma-70 family RNA polymerase sigma factor [Nodularia spumigena]MEA5614564.1 sigma-70 family RNA polymerase sigma factor [Nodularia spumigena UHCC 0040]